MGGIPQHAAGPPAPSFRRLYHEYRALAGDSTDP